MCRNYIGRFTDRSKDHGCFLTTLFINVVKITYILSVLFVAQALLIELKGMLCQMRKFSMMLDLPVV